MFDTGCGLSGDAQHLFQPYAQDRKGTARKTRTRFERGTGLGLAISAQLVRLMGGDIGLENRSDGVTGARFWFWVPVSPPGILATDNTTTSAYNGTPGSVNSSVHGANGGQLTPGSWSGSAGSLRVGDGGSDGGMSDFTMHQEQRRSRRANASFADASALDCFVNKSSRYATHGCSVHRSASAVYMDMCVHCSGRGLPLG